MAIQILALRAGADPKRKSEVWFEKGIRAVSVEDIFLRPLEIIQSKVPESERYNVYYTVSECLEQPGRVLEIQHHIPFDVDGLDVPPPGGEHLLEPLARVICSAIGVPYESVAVLYSGNGLQFLVGIKKPIEDVEYFEQNRKYYGLICDKIDAALKIGQFEGKADRSVWSRGRLMRYPCTRNLKEGKPERLGVILNPRIDRLDFDVKSAAGVPEVAILDQVTPALMKTLTADDTTIMAECQFMQWAKEKPAELDEPNWYAMLSIASRMQGGDKLCHELSSPHPKYSYEETARKIAQSQQASGPRTCKNIQALSGKCVGCIHNGTTLVSPIMIEGPDHVKTKGSGFYFVGTDTNGNAKKTKPDVHGLAQHFKHENKAVVMDTSRMVYTWRGSHYEHFGESYLLKYANTHFDPKPNNSLRYEFANTVYVGNIVRHEFFTSDISGKMNFKNGVLDIKTRTLTEHSASNGFRSVLSCDYDSGATCPNFDKFLDQVTLGRQGLKDILQEYMGYIFANEGCHLEKALVLVGEGANGKSTLVEIIRTLAGMDAVSSLSFSDCNHEQKLCLLDGKLVNICEENSVNSFKETDKIKNLISGGITTAKQVYAPPYQFRNQAKFIMLCNTLPMLTDHTEGFYRKMIIVPFDATFSDKDGTRDIHIAAKLKAELPGIFNWIMEGYLRLLANGKFTQSADVDATLDGYKDETHSIYGWFQEECMIIPGDEDTNYTARDELYTSYQLWCDMAGIRNVLARSRVLKYIALRIKKKLGHEPKIRRPSGGNRELSNIRLVTVKV